MNFTLVRSSTMMRRNYLLLEVLIALSLICLCFTPILAPQLALIKAQKSLITALDNDRIAALVFADIKELLYNNTVELNSIPLEGGSLSVDENRTGFSITETLSNGTDKTFTGYYDTTRKNKSSEKYPNHPCHLIIVKLYFDNDEEKMAYTYNVLAERHSGGAK